MSDSPDDIRPTPPVNPPGQTVELLRREVSAMRTEQAAHGRRLETLEKNLREIAPAVEELDDRLDEHDRQLKVIEKHLSHLDDGMTEVVITGQATNKKLDRLLGFWGIAAE